MTRYYNTLNTTKTSAPHRALMFVICLIASLSSTNLWAQTIGGNVYGGGNQGNVGKSSTVELHSGTIQGDVYGGARKANVGERTFVDINATKTLIVKGVYGGNDISGTIGHVAESDDMPFNPLITGIDKSWNSFISVAKNSVPVIIGSLYGGGNGAYEDNEYTNGKTKPVLGKTYIELNGGIYGQVYAGGNNAKVTDNTVLYMNNEASLSIPTGDFLSWFDNTDYTQDGDNITFNHHVSRMFGGNNLADMSIRPTWNLIAGSINNLYSGGNKGAMTAKDGISLTLASAGLTVNNVYGGCRMADVNPSEMTSSSDGYAAHVKIEAGDITNVYGGNDISGKVNYGTKVEIFSSITGDVYGGGNGSYAYTDNQAWVNAHPEDADYYYNPRNNSADALFNFRPHVEKTLIHIAGNDDQNPLNLRNVYCGGNSAPIYSEVEVEGEGATAILKLGKNISKIDNVFLGSNGENMATEKMLKLYKEEGFSSLDFTNSDVLARYMDGVSVNAKPNLEIEKGVTNITIGSFFCGGNVGSMTYEGVADITLPSTITISDKIVAGCNDAVVPAVDQLNALYEGGILGPKATTVNGTESTDRVKLTVHSKLNAILDGEIYKGANVYGGCYNSGVTTGNVEINVNSNIITSVSDNIALIPFDEKYLHASTLSIYGGGYGSNTTIYGNTTINLTENARVLKVFGGGEMGSVLGTATINLNSGNVGNVYGGGFAEGYTAETSVNIPDGSVIKANAIFGGALGASEGRPCDVGESNITFASASAIINDGIYGGNHTARATKETNITISTPVMNQHGNLLSIYGAGYGEHTIAGFTNVTLEAGAQVAKVYGGGREGKVYNHYKYCTTNGYPSDRQAIWNSTADGAYNTHINIKGTSEGIARVTGNVYGAGYGNAAHTSGKTKVQLLGGTVDGDIYGGGEKGTMPVMTNVTHGFIKNTAQDIAALCVIDGGQVRNVFGGGYQGNIEGNSGVNIGSKPEKPSFYAGVPTILRSAYGGGEMAKVSGTSTVNMYNGYVGYRYDSSNGYQPELRLNSEDDDNLLKENGNLYGAGFGEGAVVMNTKVNLYDGTVRNGVYGGGEIAAVGDGVRNDNGTYTVREGGQTNVYMYGGLVEGDVFGGGRGFSYDLTGNQVIGKTLYSDGYVFGKTNVEIYRGTIGTDASLAEGHGNVFGGGNIGYVYSSGVKYEDPTNLAANKIKGHYYTDNGYTTRTEDCKVLISARSLVSGLGEDATITIGSKKYKNGDYVENADLNTLSYPISDNDNVWQYLDTEGVTIRNAVFAGGNVSAGSDRIYANAKTVFGNATASVVDVFNRDFVTLGGENVGGLYGDGNLTFVDGYRELNITNYGTDYYHLESELESLDGLSEREKAYYMYDADKKKWFINSTSGRTMNTIQRADFCGVFGSRFLLHGARDRVPDIVDYTNYTINRVGEVSLNKKAQGSTTHGNYFGIYNVVNQLGALTSDVDFHTTRREADEYMDGDNTGLTYYQFKNENKDQGYRNKAKSHNKIALASGVYLELIESITLNELTKEVISREYGPVTGVIELDLINVTPGEGGGYVYAKDLHGTRNINGNTKQYTLSTANTDAVTKAAYTYTDIGIQSSGNFVHNTQTVVDDCFNNDVHYWYVSGSVYVYDQKISAFTGVARKYAQSIKLPFTYKKGKIEITDIGKNRYFVGKGENTSLTLNNKTYHIGDSITYWDWYQIEIKQSTKGNGYQNYFAEDIYVNESGSISSTSQSGYNIANEMSNAKGYMLTLETDNPEAWKEKSPTFNCNTSGIYGQRQYEENDVVGYNVIEAYSKITQTKPENQATFVPAYVAIENVTIGTSQYNKGNCISKTTYDELGENSSKFAVAYICKNTLKVDDSKYIFINELISQNEYKTLKSYVTRIDDYFDRAYVCTKAGKYGGKDYFKDQNYSAVDVSTLPIDDRNSYFNFNKDALDLFLINNINNDLYEPYKGEQPLTSGTSIETTSLYVPSSSDIKNLSKDRIISVVLTYTPDKNGNDDYDEEETKGAEKHVINIHIEFKSGQPIVGDVVAPAPVLPNTTIGLSVPSIIPGAYDIIGGGWEIFKNQEDAESFKNGMPYLNNATPMYWYQNNYYVAYYAKTYLGKSYSTPVPFTIANYHRLGEVMNHPEYMYIDHEDVKRAPKIYIDATGSENATMNDLDYLAELYTKSLDANELGEQVKGCANLEFILRSDIAPKNKKNNWTSIGGDAQCFAGTLHGNGYTISDLNNSLFGKLCGKVYNLGVTGTFTGGGIADNGDENGHAKNCWIYTTGTPNMKAVIGNDGYIINSYYHADNAFTEGTATKKDASAFLNGEVTYLLNNFHIEKRSNSQQERYVEDYFADGDFIYAKGEIPTTKDIRYDETSKTYQPIDDDYIFFGQRLTYNEGTHGSLPTRIDKVLDEQNNVERINRAENGNRVYSAPAYFMNKTPSLVYFNTAAKFVDSYDNKPIHHGLTAIDFTGHGEGASKLDFEKLTSFALGDTDEQKLTKNLLVYANEESENNQLYADMSENLKEPPLAVSTEGYKTIDQNNTDVRGHLVTKQNSNYIALTDQFLVDRENFNVPIAYEFAEGKRMWYQRTPDRFAEGNNAGWDIICLPFTAQLVTTHQKGEITHFYGNSTTNHEYWLRQLSEVTTTTEGDASTTTAAFTRPAAGNTDYTATNKFLFEKFYEYNGEDNAINNDPNGEDYHNYYNSARTFANYAYLTANTPYIISFPGAYYKEFDMSGTNDSPIMQLDPQVVTMVSEAGATIGVTDDVTDDRTATANGYSLVGTFQTEDIADGYLINATGNAFEKAHSSQLTAQSSLPFRGYLVKTPSQSSAPKFIMIGGEVESVEEPEEDITSGELIIYGVKGGICIESTLENEKSLTIYRTSGQMVSRINVFPMTKEVFPVPSPGLYIINNKKIMVR